MKSEIMKRKYNLDYVVKNSGKCELVATCSTCMYSRYSDEYDEVTDFYCVAYPKGEINHE